MDINILLIAFSEEARDKYKKTAQDFGVNVIAVPSFKNLDKSITEKRYHGLMVDLPTKFKAVKEDEGFVRNIIEKFPVVHLNLNKKTQEIKALYYGQQPGGSLEEFFNNECRSFTPRRFRYHVRKLIHFNLILSKDSGFKNGSCDRTATMDVSRGGCFIFSVQPWNKENDVWFIIKELRDNKPIYGQVRHHVRWGTELQLPGIGVEYMDIKNSQMAQICDDYRL